MAKRVLLLGYFGAENYGDDLILRAFLARYQPLLKRAGYRLAVATKRRRIGRKLLSTIPEGSELDLVPLTPFLPFSPNLSEFTHLICPGGSLLQNATSNRSLWYYLAIIRRFLVSKRPVFMLNQGVGPISGAYWRQEARWHLAQVSFFSARDRVSWSWGAGVLPDDRIMLTSDTVFAVPPPQLLLSSVSTLSTHFLVGVVLRSASSSQKSYRQKLNLWMEVMLRLRKQGRILLASFQPSDGAICCDLAKALRSAGGGVEVELSSERVAYLLSACQVILSERYHGLVLALIAQLPFCGLGADPKLQAFCQEAGMPWGILREERGKGDSPATKIEVPSFTPQELAKLVLDLAFSTKEYTPQFSRLVYKYQSAQDHLYSQLEERLA